MKKRSPPQSHPPANDSSSASSSPSLSSSSSSCVVDYHDHEEDKPSKPKRARRTRAINPKSDEKCPISDNTPTTNRRSSIYRGVTRHRWTGRFEAHLWDKSCWNSIQNKKGRQVYLGAYDGEVDAARTYDLAALKYWGPETTLNFPIENYTKELEEMQNVSKEEYLASLRRRSSGFSRGVSKYRGVARHHHNGRWEARIGRVFGNKYLYLGTFSSQEEAAAAYDLAAIEYRGPNAVTNFDISNYIDRVKNIMPTGAQPQQPNTNKTKPVQRRQQQQQPQQQQIKQQEEEDEQQDQPRVQEQQDLQEVRKQEEMATPSQFEESKLDISSDDHSPMLVMGTHVDDEDRENNPWSFCLDTGGYDPLLVPDIPLEEDGRVLDLFDQTGFEDNIDLIFEGEGNSITLDETYFGGTKDVGCQTGMKPSEDSSKKMEISSKIENSFSSSSPSSPSSTTSLVTCQQ